jgi:hypothetical protein
MSKPWWMSDAEWEELGRAINARNRGVVEAELEFARGKRDGLVTSEQAGELQSWFDL